MVSPWKVILATMVIFACGVFTGVFVARSTAPVAPTAEIAAFTNPVVLTNVPIATNGARANVTVPSFQAERLAAVRGMVNQLHLSPDQRERVTQIIKDSQERNRELWKTIAPQMRDEFNRVVQEIRTELGPAQKRRFLELLRENRERAQNPPSGPGTNNPPVVSPTNAVPAEPAR